ncbi:hypothetical protein [Arcobacter sp. FWKO B]|uniref:hypothetical protein n=1 Tax=Arcobacter sp. FWKO B TaxID=2593672 RepID=UPI0018A44B94|nr:hypothetical protein [Arcobacter sp. FWKO B]QOG12814.1 hypothetical protein FWKOB_08960 [Arcobacter sp. FWKO B]
MGLKKYFFFSLLLIILVAGYVFSLNSNDFRVSIFDNGFVLPIAVWVVLPLVVFFVLSFLHIIFYGTKSYFSKKAYEKDFEKIAELLKARVQKKDITLPFKTTEAKGIANTLTQLEIAPSNADFSSQDKDLKDLVSLIMKIEAGEYVSSKELKLPNTNPLMEKNLINKLGVDGDFCLDVIKKSSNYTQKVIDKAVSSMIKNKSITTIKKNLDLVKLDTQLAFSLFTKDSEQRESFSLTRDEIKNIVLGLNFTKADYLKLVKIYKKTFGPEEIIKLFEDLSTKNEDATSAYLYILFEYEMLDSVREILQNSSNDEYIPFKALLDLKNNGKHYRLDSLCLN